MTTRLLRLLAWLLPALALLLPLALWAARHVPPRADLRWAIADRWSQSNLDPGPVTFAFGVGLHLENRGAAPVEEIRMEFGYRPADMEAYASDGAAWEWTEGEDGRAILTLGPLPAQGRAGLRLWGSGEPLHLHADGVRVSPTDLPPPALREEPWLPNWAVASLGLLAAGLLLQILHLRRRIPVDPYA